MSLSFQDGSPSTHRSAHLADYLAHPEGASVSGLDPEALFQGIFNSMYQFIGLLKPDGELIAANQTALDFGGLTRDDVIGKPFWECRWWTISEAAQETLREAIGRAAHGIFVRYEAEVLGAGDRTAVIDFSLQPLMNEQGEVVLIIPEGRDVTERKQAEEQLRTSEALLGSVLNASLDGIMAFQAVRDEDGTIVDFEWLMANARSEALTGRKPSDLPGRRLLVEMPGNRDEGLFEAYVDVVEGGEPWRETIHYAHDAIDRWFQIVAVKMGDGFAVTFRDITREQQLEETLKALAASRTGTWELDREVGRVMCSATTASLFRFPAERGRYPLEELLAKVHPRDRDHLRATLADATDTYAAEFRVQGPGRSVHWIAARGAVVRDGYGERLVGALSDVTGRKRAELELTRMAAIVANTDDAVTRQTVDGVITHWNQAAERIYGYPAAEVMGASVKLITPEERHDEVEALLRRMGEGETIQAFETQRRTSDGRVVDIALSMSPIRDTGGEVIAITTIERDITERRQQERRLRESEARYRELAESLEQRVEERTAELKRSNAELDQFAYVASHDLKAPLRAIDNLSTWVLEDVGDDLPDASRRHLTKLQERAKRMERLLEDLLEYSRVGRRRGRVETVDTGSLIRDVVEILAVPDAFTVEIPDALPMLETPRAPLEKVFRNLIGNAIKHHDRGEGTVRVAWKDRGALAEFVVADDGPGIPPKFHDRIFQMFETLQPRDRVEGSGMGLAVVRKAVEHEGGTIEVESAGERGTTFRFTWPKRSPVDTTA